MSLNMTNEDTVEVLIKALDPRPVLVGEGAE